MIDDPRTVEGESRASHGPAEGGVYDRRFGVSRHVEDNETLGAAKATEDDLRTVWRPCGLFVIPVPIRRGELCRACSVGIRDEDAGALPRNSVDDDIN